MGLRSWFKSKFKKEIKVDEKRVEEFVILHNLKHCELKLGSTVKVQEGYNLALANKGKVYDILPVGEWEINGLTIPKCVKKFKLAKPDKEGNLPKSFNIRLYYVYLGENTVDFKSYRKIEFKSNELGVFKAKVKGSIKFKTENIELFMKSLFTVYNYIKQDETKTIIADWVSEFITDKMQKFNFPIEELLKVSSVENKMQELLKEKLKKYGLTLDALILEEIKISNKTISKYKALLEKKELEKHKQVLEPTQNSSSPFIQSKSVNFSYESKEPTQEILPTSTESNESVFTDWNNFGEKENKNFIDLEQNSLYDINKDNNKLCPHCLALNNKNNERCKACGKLME